jgi:hypothetical protein
MPQEQQNKGVGINAIAAELDTEPRTLRVFVRKMELGRVGRGSRYRSESNADPGARRAPP